MDNLLAQFIEETRDLVQQASSDFLKLEENPDDPDILNSLFRSMHTIKGSSGVFELTPLTELVHEAENILDKARDGEFTLTPDVVDVFLDILDQINIWMDELESEEKLGPDAEEYSNKLKQRLLAISKDITPKAPDISKELADTELEHRAKAPEITQEILDAVTHIPVKHRLAIIKDAPDWDVQLNLITYEPNENCFFTGDDPVITVKKTPFLQGFSCGLIDIDREDFDPFKCILKFSMISSAPSEELEEHFAYVLDEINIFPITIFALLCPCGDIVFNEHLELFVEDAMRLVEQGELDELLDAIKVVKEIISETSYEYAALSFLEIGISKSPPLPVKWIKSLIQSIKSHEFVVPEDRDAENIVCDETQDKSKEKIKEFSEIKKIPVDDVLKDIIKKQVELLELECDEKIKPGQLKSIKNMLTNILSSCGYEDVAHAVLQQIDNLMENFSYELAKETKQNLLSRMDFLFKEQAVDISSEISSEENKCEKRETVTKNQTRISPPISKDSRIHHPQIKTEVKVLKVDQEQIDSLMDLVSELVVAKNALPYLARRAEEEFKSRELGRELKGQYATINRICEEIQGIVMQIRMIPVSHVFQRFPRLVRDISRSLNKKVKLTIEGEETRADKNVLEKMTDPLVHLIRNSLDHGIESPDERVACGKEEEGHIILAAHQLEDQVVIEVRDDGRGIDVEKVKQKAYEKGLIDEESLGKLSNEQALDLIFAPGLSTAKKVTDVSGRGVGMDVVRAMVEEVGGSVKIRSEPQKGTTITLSLPLSMAVTRILMIEVGGEFFGVPIENVSETVKIPSSEIHKVKDKEVIVLRNRIIPIYNLRSVLGIEEVSDQGRKYSELEENIGDEDEMAILILTMEKTEFGLIVDKFHEGIDIVLKPLEGAMQKYSLYSGATLLGDGRVLLILNPKELIRWL